jgi:hypothetical protein
MNTVADSAFASMHHHLEEAAVALFESYGMRITPVPSAGGALGNEFPGGDGKVVLGVIGYVGHKVRGALVLLTSRAAVEQWHSVMGGLETNDVCDTLGEFSNMLLGHLKSRLLQEGFPILLSTPTTASAGALHVPAAIAPSRVLSFTGPGWRLDVRLDATFEDGFTLKEASARTTTATPGDVVLF